MAEPMSIIAGISSVASLADVSCSLAGSLYKTFRAIKHAPRAVQTLSKELEQLHDVLQDVDNLLQRYSTSLLVTEDGLSIDSVQSVLQKCQAELESVQKSAATSKPDPSKLKNAAARLKWVFDEPKIKQHCQNIEQLRRDVDTRLSLLSHQYDINARERDKSLHSQVMEVRNVLDTSATETRSLVRSEVVTVRSDVEQVAAKVAISQEGLQKNIQNSHDHLYQEVSHAGVQMSHGIERIQNDLRDTNLLVQRNWQHTRQEILQLNQSIRNIDSMLSQVLLLYSEREESLLDSSLTQHPHLEGLMLSLLMMKSSLVSAVSELKSESSWDISDEEIDFLLNEFESLVAFSHDASALRIRQRCIKGAGGDRPSRRWTNHTSMAGNYALDVDSFSQPTVPRRERLRTLTHANSSGILKLSFENRTGDFNGRPSSILNATFSYHPNINVHRTGVYASFRKEMRMGLNPSIERSLRVTRVFNFDDSIYHRLMGVIGNDDLCGLQRMLSCGDIRPWDRDMDGWNLLTMALWWGDYLGQIINYLLVDAWDIENCEALQSNLWRSYWECATSLNDSGRSRDVDIFLQQSKRISALGQVIDADIIHDVVRTSSCSIFSTPGECDFDDILEFFIDQGADIGYRDSFRDETALLVVAESDHGICSRMIPVLLRLNADCSAVDYKGRGPLHLALKQTRDLSNRFIRLHSRDLIDKLVCLLQAGCSIHAADNYGRTPTDVARRWGRTKAWEAALQEVDKLECATLDCQCENITEERLESSTGHSWGSSSTGSEDSAVDSINIDLFDPLFFSDEDNDRFSEVLGDSEQDTDADEDEDQGGDTDGLEYNVLRTDTDEEESEDENRDSGKGEDEALDENLDIAVDNESARNEDKLDSSALTTPQVSRPNPSPTPKSHHETIASGQHHLWIV